MKRNEMKHPDGGVIGLGSHLVRKDDGGRFKVIGVVPDRRNPDQGVIVLKNEHDGSEHQIRRADLGGFQVDLSRPHREPPQFWDC